MTDSNKHHRSQIEWHCRRGMLELDVVLMRYLERDFDAADQDEKDTFETLLSLQDPEILDLLTGRIVAEDDGLRHVIKRILANSRSEDL
jgi:antitoxin CptB